MGNFDHLIPKNKNTQTENRFSHLIPKKPSSSEPFTRKASRYIAESTPDIYQLFGNIVGYPVGAAMTLPSGGVVNPQSASAFGGAAMRSLGSIGRDLAYSRKPDIERAKREFQYGMGGEMLGFGAGKAIEKVGKWAYPMAKRTILSYLKPKDRLVDKGDEIADTILTEGLAKGGQRRMINEAVDKISTLQNEVDNIIARYGHKKSTAKKAVQYLDELERRYMRQADPDAAEVVRKTKDKLMSSYNVMEPIYGPVEKGAFVMGGETKLTKPTLQTRKIPQEGSLGIPQQPKVMRRIAEETTYGYGEPVKGGSRKVTQKVGEKYRKFGLDDLREQKQQQYINVRDKYGAEYTPEIESRKQWARGAKESIEEAIPHEPVAAKNMQTSKLIDVTEAIADRLPVSERRDLLGLVDSVMAGASVFNPKAAAFAFGRKVLGSELIKNYAARKLYENYLKSPIRSAVASSPSVRVMLSRLLSRE